MMRIVAMRRTKTQKVNGKPLVELPDRQLFIQPVELSLEERKLYDSMAKEGKLVIGRYVQIYGYYILLVVAFYGRLPCDVINFLCKNIIT